MQGERDTFINEIAAKIAGDIVLSRSPGRAMRKWRKYFRISQSELAAHMGLSPSVISDYESGRRKSPGASVIRRFVTSLIEIDEQRGMVVLSTLMKLSMSSSALREAILDMREFSRPVTVAEFCDKIDAELLTAKEALSDVVLGYTVVDSIKLVINVPAYEYIKLYGFTTQRAAVFTKVTHGRSPLVAVKAMQAGLGGLRPALIVLHGPKEVDRLGLLIAERERLPLALCRLGTVEELLKRLAEVS